MFGNDNTDFFSISGITSESKPQKKRDKRRSFTRTMKNEIWAKQKGVCAKCKNKLDPRHTEYDHKIPWSEGGPTSVSNGVALCANCHKIKTHKTRLSKTKKKRKTTKKQSSILGGGLFSGSSGLFGAEPKKKRGRKKKKLVDDNFFKIDF